MYIKKFYHTIDGTPLKFTIHERTINSNKYYFAMLIATDLEDYKHLPEQQKETRFGIPVTDGHQNIVYYSSAQELENDIRTKYGFEQLKSEING